MKYLQSKFVQIALVIVGVLYPFLVYYGLEFLNLKILSLFVLVLFFIRCFFTQSAFTLQTLAVLVLFTINILLGVVYSNPQFLMLTPFFISLSLFFVFWLSLFKEETIVMQMAKKMSSEEVPPEAYPYCKNVTRIWCLFFIFNSSVAFYTALLGDYKLWTFYNGFFSYILIGAIMSVEFLFRQFYKMKIKKTQAITSLFLIFSCSTFTTHTCVAETAGQEKRSRKEQYQSLRQSVFVDKYLAKNNEQVSQRAFSQNKNYKAKFFQEKSIPELTKPLKSSGTFSYLGVDGIIWNTEKPFSSEYKITVSDLVHSQNGKELKRIQSDKHPLLGAISNILLAIFHQNFLELKQIFEVHYYQLSNSQNWKIGLKTKDKRMREFVGEILIEGDKTVKRVWLVENKDLTFIQFSDISFLDEKQ